MTGIFTIRLKSVFIKSVSSNNKYFIKNCWKIWNTYQDQQLSDNIDGRLKPSATYNMNLIRSKLIEQNLIKTIFSHTVNKHLSGDNSRFVYVVSFQILHNGHRYLNPIIPFLGSLLGQNLGRMERHKQRPILDDERGLCRW